MTPQSYKASQWSMFDVERWRKLARGGELPANRRLALTPLWGGQGRFSVWCGGMGC